MLTGNIVQMCLVEIFRIDVVKLKMFKLKMSIINFTLKEKHQNWKKNLNFSKISSDNR